MTTKHIYLSRDRITVELLGEDELAEYYQCFLDDSLDRVYSTVLYKHNLPNDKSGEEIARDMAHAAFERWINEDNALNCPRFGILR